MPLDLSHLVPINGGQARVSGTELDIDGSVQMRGGTMQVGALGSDNSGQLTLINATLDDATVMWNKNLTVHLVGASVLNLQPMQFLSPVVLDSQPATIHISGLKDFARETYNSSTGLVDLFSHSNVVLASLKVYDQVPRTALAMSSHTDAGTTVVTLGLHHVG